MKRKIRRSLGGSHWCSGKTAQDGGDLSVDAAGGGTHNSDTMMTMCTSEAQAAPSCPTAGVAAPL